MSNQSTNTPRPVGPGGPGGPGGRMTVGQKPKDFKKSLGQLLSYAKTYHTAIIAAIICAMLGVVCTLMGPDRLSQITDTISAGLMTGIDLSSIVRMCAVLGIIYGIGALLTFIQGVLMVRVTQRLDKSLRTSISGKINRMPLKYFDGTTYGNVLSRVTNDVDAIGQSLNQSVGQLVSAVTLFVGCLIMMFVTNATLAVTALLATFSGFIAMQVIMKVSQKYFIRRQNYLGLINGQIEEVYSGHNIVKVYGGTTEAKRQFEELNDALYDSNWKSQFLSGLMMPIMNFIGNFGYVAVCVVGALLAMNGHITFGVIVAFMVYIRLFTQPLSQIAQSATSLQSAAAASERVFEFLNEEELSDESKKPVLLETAKGNVSFDHVSFGYSPEKTIIKDFSVDIKAGQKVAIVGPTGAGKTTMVNLLMRFYELNKGKITIDGINIADMSRENVHDLFCMVLQDTWLFEGTIRENIVYCKEGVTDEEVTAACKAVGIHHLIRTLPHGYNTILNDKANLSAGERQLITIARAMIENAPLLILDEATSSVDTRTEALVQEAMDKLTIGRTSFVIAHRLSTIKNADIILVMKDGDIVEKGNHEELLTLGGLYAELYNSQFAQ